MSRAISLDRNNLGDDTSEHEQFQAPISQIALDLVLPEV
jgi:hypothetical protein